MPSTAAKLLIAAVVLAPGAVRAEPVADKATGLAVTAPPGYEARKLTPRTGQAARMEVKKASDTDTGCQVVFTPAPQNNRLKQAELDATLRGPQWQEAARSAVANGYDVQDSGIADVNGHTAMVITGDFKERPDMPARAKEVRTLMVIRETPRGRTSTVCVGDKAGFDARRAEFMAIAGDVRAP